MAYISIGGLADGGFVPDHPPYDLPPNVFDEVEDVYFTLNGVRPAFKPVEVFTPNSINPLFVSRIKLGAGVEGWVYFDENDAYIIQGENHTKITRVDGDGGQYNAKEETRWHEAILHGIPIYSNGIDAPQQLDPNAPQAPLKNLANWDATVKAGVIRPYKNFLIALRIQTGGGAYNEQMILWSDPADPGNVPPSWDYTNPATQAGLVTLSETDDRIVDGLALGDEFIIYKERSIYSLRYIGGTFVMSLKRRPGDIGLLTAGAIASVPMGHVFVSSDNVYVYSGQGVPREVADGRVRRELFKGITDGQKSKLFVKHDSTNSNVMVFYPSGGSVWCNKVAVWNYVNNTWTLLNVPHVSGADFGEVRQGAQLTWDDVSDVWGGLYTTSWEAETSTWDTILTSWGANADNSTWEQDTTTWDYVKSWDDQLATDIWDATEYTPVTENLVMATRITEEAVYDPLTNTMGANGVIWSGVSKYPPMWLIPQVGDRLQGRLVKRGIAIVGKNHRGELEVNRTVVKILTEFYPEMEFGQIEIRFGVQDTPKSVVDWDEWMEFDSEAEIKLDPFISGKFLAFEIRGISQVGSDWLLSGYGMEIKKGGRY